MIQKTISIYSDTHSHSPFNHDTLVVEINNNHIACLVKAEKDNNVSAFEFFKIENEDDSWDDIFYELRTHSTLIDKSYNNTQIFYHLPESVIIPASKFTDGNQANYISLIHGIDDDAVLLQDAIKLKEPVYNIYRVNKNLHETVNRNFLSIKEYHTYTGIINYLFLANKAKEVNFINVKFYNKDFIISVVKNNQLQIIQSFDYQNAEEVLYHLLNVADKFGLPGINIYLTIGGAIDVQGKVFNLIQSYFNNIHLENSFNNTAIVDKMATHSSHNFTPFFNLQA